MVRLERRGGQGIQKGAIMKLDRVTITGADDSIEPFELLPLSRKFPFVEWGILLSYTGIGRPRYPSEEWLWRFRFMQRHFPVKASLHLCGMWMRDLLMGKIADELTTFIDCFDRLQLNVGPGDTYCKWDDFRVAIDRLGQFKDPMHHPGHPLHRGFQVIFQIAGSQGEELYRQTFHHGRLTSEISIPLFDASGGRGVVPDRWPSPLMPDLEHGYAGGLGPESLAEQIPLILVRGPIEQRCWIDMETRVRSNDGYQFDLAKVRACLEIAKPFVEGQ